MQLVPITGRFDTIPAVTDSRPASHVAVAITLYAKASSAKTNTSATYATLKYIKIDKR